MTSWNPSIGIEKGFHIMNASALRNNEKKQIWGVGFLGGMNLDPKSDEVPPGWNCDLADRPNGFVAAAAAFPAQ
jgi:hypothetical protein